MKIVRKKRHSIVLSGLIAIFVAVTFFLAGYLATKYLASDDGTVSEDEMDEE